MKKISIMLLAALMLFAFVVCNPDETGDEPAALAVDEAAQADQVLGTQAASLFVEEDGYAIATDNKVTATLKNDVTGVTGYPVETVTAGYFLPVKVTTDFGTGDNAKADIKVVVAGLDELDPTTVTFKGVEKNGFVLIYLGDDIATMTNVKATLTATNAASEKWEVVLDLSQVKAAAGQTE